MLKHILLIIIIFGSISNVQACCILGDDDHDYASGMPRESYPLIESILNNETFPEPDWILWRGEHLTVEGGRYVKSIREVIIPSLSTPWKIKTRIIKFKYSLNTIYIDTDDASKLSSD